MRTSSISSLFLSGASPVLAAVVLLATVGVVGCHSYSRDLSKFPCDRGQCIKGFACHPETNICVDPVMVDCSHEGGICPSTVQAGDACASPDSFLPCADTVANCDLGCRTCKANKVWSECTPPRDFTPPTSTSDFAAIPDDGAASISWVYPTDLDLGQCVLMRRQGSVPTDHTSGTVVTSFDSPAPGANGGFTDTGLTNGVSYFFAIFCSDVSGNWNDSEENAVNSDRVTPVGRVADFVAIDGRAGRVPIAFTMPEAAVACRVVRKDGSFPTSSTDGTTIGTDQSGSGLKTLNDTTVTDGLTYYYAVFCRADSRLRMTTVIGGQNADTALPISLVSNFLATGGEDHQTTITFTTPVNAAACKIVRKDGSAAPTNDADGAQLGTFYGSETAVNVVDDTIANGSSHYYAVFCQVDGNFNESTVTLGSNGNPAVALAIVNNLAATSGENASSTITFTTPVGSAACKVLRRNDGSYPTGPDDSTAVAAGVEQTGSNAAVSFVDHGLSNGTWHNYAVFCRADNTYRNPNHVDPMNARTALPINNVIDFTASDGESGQTTLKFHSPPGSTYCKVMKKNGSGYPGFPSGPGDGAASLVGSEKTADAVNWITVTDNSVAYGSAYYYAVFCRVDTTYRSSVVVPGQNADTGVSGNTVIISHHSLGCTTLKPDGTAQALIGVDVIANGVVYSPHLTSLTFTTHTKSNTATDTQLTNAQLFEDTNGNGVYDNGIDTLRAGPVSFSSGVAAFTGPSAFDMTLAVSTPKLLFLVANVQADPDPKMRYYYAAQINGTGSFTISSGKTILLPTNPPTLQLFGNAHAISDLTPACSFAEPGSSRIKAVGSISLNTTNWQTAAESSVSPNNQRFYPIASPPQSSSPGDCNLDDDGYPDGLSVSDGGSSSRFLHINTGVPLGLPICDLNMRFFATDSLAGGPSATGCGTGLATNRLFSNYTDGACTNNCPGLDHFYFYWYTAAYDNCTDGIVQLTGTGPVTPSTIAAGPVSTDGCFTQSFDYNLKAFYDLESAVPLTAPTNFHVRFVADSGDGLATSAGISISHLPEIYVRIQ